MQSDYERGDSQHGGNLNVQASGSLVLLLHSTVADTKQSVGLGICWTFRPARLCHGVQHED